MENLLRQANLRGLVYAVNFTPVTRNGPHLNEAQFERVLTRTQYQIWCSHHPSFYLESIRFRTALLTGAVPLKVYLNELRQAAPFQYLTLDQNDFIAQWRALDFETIRARFAQDYCACPSFQASLGDALRQLA